jgi:uncharacterized protein (DUF2147 family)
MRGVNLILVVIFLQSLSLNAQTIFGKWQTLDEQGAVESIVEVYNFNGKVYAKVIDILQKNKKDALCDKCTGKNKCKPILGLVILKGLEKNGKEWNNGKILDPKNGKYYKCYITLDNENKLKLRGYIGISLIGRTEYWYRDNS